MRNWVAVCFHLPGLWLFYRERAEPALLRTNVVAVVATLAAMGLGAALSPPAHRLLAALLLFGVGHFAWGFYLARHLRSRAR